MYGKNSYSVDKFLLAELELIKKLRATRVRADTRVLVIEVYYRLLERNKLIIVSCLGNLLGCEMRAVEGDGCVNAEAEQAVTNIVCNSYPTSVNVCHILLRLDIMLEMIVY